jgi:hypothetical protein
MAMARPNGRVIFDNRIRGAKPMAYQTCHSNPLWQYETASGVLTTGHFAHFTDYGGTDVTYYFRSCETGELDLVSGARLKRAKRLWQPCGKSGNIPE